jgi:hypothetical protein
MAQTDVALTELRDEVAQNTSVIEGAVALFERLSTMLDANADDPDEIRTIAASLRNQRETRASAIVEHTPAEEPTPNPTPEPNPVPNPTPEP